MTTRREFMQRSAAIAALATIGQVGRANAATSAPHEWTVIQTANAIANKDISATE